MRFIDFSSWQSLLTAVISLALITLIGIGIRMLVMLTIQQRQQRMNRQINERLKTLIAAYKVLGGSFTGDLTVDPMHLRQLRQAGLPVTPKEGDETILDVSPPTEQGSDRRRRVRDAVEAALSDIILLGTEEHVRLAERAARELVAGHTVHTHEIVASLRDFIRKALDLEPIPADVAVPLQGPARPSNSASRGGGDRRGEGGGSGGGGGMGAGGTGGGVGMGMAIGGRDPHAGS